MMKVQERAPIQATPAVMKNGQENPRWSTRNPVSSGAHAPPRFPMKFCKPVQRPTIAGPARVCGIAHVAQAAIPNIVPLKANIHGSSRSDASAVSTSAMPSPVHPTAIEPLRTRVGEDPVRIQRSESFPQTAAAMAYIKKSNPPSIDIICIERCRPRTRYEGNQVNRKYKK